MKVFAEFTEKMFKSRATDRIIAAIKRYAPARIKFVDTKESADLVILYAYGRREHLKIEMDRLLGLGKKCVIVQLCIKSTRNPDPADWLPLWKNAVLVWSYYDLQGDFNFYHAPLGLDDAFKNPPPTAAKKDYVIASSGLGYLIESVRECIHAALGVNKRVFHVGPIVTNKPEVDHSNGISDEDLARKYATCEFVSGLRRGEGFELPIIEGLMCGARPIAFDRPDNRHWFGKLAVFIPETSRDGIVENLAKIFREGAKPVTKREMALAKKRFNWETIIKGFWKRIVCKS